MSSGRCARGGKARRPGRAVTIVAAGTRDLPGIMVIYNDAVLHSAATFDVTPRTPKTQLEWFCGHGPKHPVIVARCRGRVVGWGSLSAYHERCAYSTTVEDSVYVAANWCGKGLGKRLLRRLIERARRLGHHTIIARIADHGAASIGLHRSVGFAEVGVLREVGRKFGRWVDVTEMQLFL